MASENVVRLLESVILQTPTWCLTNQRWIGDVFEFFVDPEIRLRIILKDRAVKVFRWYGDEPEEEIAGYLSKEDQERIVNAFFQRKNIDDGHAFEEADNKILRYFEKMGYQLQEEGK